MKHIATLALALTLTASAQSTQPSAPLFTDPANLRGERVQPRDGRELPVDTGARGLQQLLRRLNTRASVLNIVAHPDDEDGGMLTLYSRGLGARVADISLTRGEGGQNAMTGDFEDALGLLRTQELLANDRYTGVDQFFGTEVDFGFSKTKQESFAKWGHDRVLYDVVRAIRLYRPLVLTSTWTGGVTDGHGQHQVAGQIAQEAFLAAGDPKVFPDMIAEGILPWQPLRIYARVPRQSISPKGLYDYATNQYVPATFTNYVTGEVSTTVPTTGVLVHEATPDPLLDGQTYIQFARLGLAQQKSQMGPQGVPTPTGTFDVPYHLYGDCTQTPAAALITPPELCHNGASLQSPPKSVIPSAAEGPATPPTPASPSALSPPNLGPAFFTGIDTSLEGIADLAPHAPPSLRHELRSLADDIAEAQQALQKDHRQQLVEALERASSNLSCLTQRLGGSPQPNIDVECVLPDSAGLATVSGAELANVQHELRVKQAQLIGARFLALNLQLKVTAPSNGGSVEVGQPLSISVQYSSPTPYVYVSREKLLGTWVEGQGRQGSDTEGVDHLELTTAEARRFTATLPYFHRKDIEQPVYDLSEPDLRNAPLAPAPLIVKVPITTGDNFEVPIVVTGAATGQPIRFVPPAGTPEAERLEVIGYGDLPRTNYIARPAKHVSMADIKLPNRRHIAYLPGTGDAVPEALTSIGLTPTVLTVADLTPTTLAKYDTVILGVRTYEAHPDLHGAPTQALLDYARHGGNVVVQYQSPEFTAADAPYPLSLGSNEKVVDETAPVALLSATSPLLTTPNRITPADFNNWVEERGHGFLSTWDPHYTALTETHDPGAPSEHIAPQLPQRGGLITTPLGQGRWTYCAFALYRQLPEAVPGAFRLFANLLNP
jgi:LmbE family N-acetylglucosaminyl deacetylase